MSCDRRMSVCWMESSDDHSEHACNCDKNDDVWREDSGLLTDKTKLPVIELRFGDNDKPQEEGHHALGKFMCYGTA